MPLGRGRCCCRRRLRPFRSIDPARILRCVITQESCVNVHELRLGVRRWRQSCSRALLDGHSPLRLPTGGQSDDRSGRGTGDTRPTGERRHPGRGPPGPGARLPAGGVGDPRGGAEGDAASAAASVLDAPWSAGGRPVTLSLATVLCAPGSVSDHRQAAGCLAPLKKAAKALHGASWVLGRAGVADHEIRRGSRPTPKPASASASVPAPAPAPAPARCGMAVGRGAQGV